MYKGDFSNEGGHPINVGDSKYIQEGIFDLVQAMSWALGDGAKVILNGLDIQEINGNYTNDSGWVIMAEQVYFIQAGGGTSGAGEYYLEAIETPGPLNPVTYEDGNAHNVHLYGSMGLRFIENGQQVPANHHLLSSFSATNLEELRSEWKKMDSPNFSSGWNAQDADVEFRYKVLGKTMHINITTQNMASITNSSSNNYADIDLPEGLLVKHSCTALVFINQGLTVGRAVAPANQNYIRFFNLNSTEPVVGVNGQMTIEIQ